MIHFIFLEEKNWWSDVFAIISPFLTFMIAWIALWIPFFTAWVARFNKKKLVKNFVDEMDIILGKVIKENFDTLVSSQNFISEIISYQGDYLKNLQSLNDVKLNSVLGNVLASIKIFEEGKRLLETMHLYRKHLKTKNAENYEWLMRQLFADFNDMKNNLSILDVKLSKINDYKVNEELIKRMNDIVKTIDTEKAIQQEKEKAHKLLELKLLKKENKKNNR